MPKSKNESDNGEYLISRIIKPKMVVRPHFDPKDEMDAGLVESIRKQGVLQPVLLILSKSGWARCTSGHRRIAACKYLGLKTVPYIRSYWTQEHRALSEMIEEIEIGGLTMDQISQKLTHFMERFVPNGWR